MKAPANERDYLTTGSQSDIWQVLTLLSTWKSSSDTLTFDLVTDLYVPRTLSFLIVFTHDYACLLFLPGLSSLTCALNCWLLAAFFVRFHCRLCINEKYTIMSPFDITQKLLGPSLFSHTSRETLGDKIELYFQDHSFMPLFVQVSVPRLAHADCGTSALFFSFGRHPPFLFLFRFSFAFMTHRPFLPGTMHVCFD